MDLQKTRKLLNRIRLAALGMVALFFLLRLIPILYIAATLLLAWIASLLIFWRCPYCRGFLGRLKKKDSCPHCHTYLYWDGENHEGL